MLFTNMSYRPCPQCSALMDVNKVGAYRDYVIELSCHRCNESYCSVCLQSHRDHDLVIDEDELFDIWRARFSIKWLHTVSCTLARLWQMSKQTRKTPPLFALMLMIVILTVFFPFVFVTIMLGFSFVYSLTNERGGGPYWFLDSWTIEVIQERTGSCIVAWLIAIFIRLPLALLASVISMILFTFPYYLIIVPLLLLYIIKTICRVILIALV